MSVFKVLVVMGKVAGHTASRWIRVHADNPQTAAKLAEATAKAAPAVLKAVATIIRAGK